MHLTEFFTAAAPIIGTATTQENTTVRVSTGADLLAQVEAPLAYVLTVPPGPAAEAVTAWLKRPRVTTPVDDPHPAP